MASLVHLRVPTQSRSLCIEHGGNCGAAKYQESEEAIITRRADAAFPVGWSLVDHIPWACVLPCAGRRHHPGRQWSCPQCGGGGHGIASGYRSKGRLIWSPCFPSKGKGQKGLARKAKNQSRRLDCFGHPEAHYPTYLEAVLL